jgi:RNA polymerase sigma factor (sigma-70 family)
MELGEFKIKVLPLRNKLFRFAKRLLNSTEEAEDIVQEVFIKLWNRREKLDEYRSVEALAMVTTRNLCLDKLKVKKITTERIEDLRNDIEETRNDRSVDFSEVIDKIHAIIQTLPEQQKSVIQLRDIEGYDFEEIAEIMEINENAIRVTLSRARKKIREKLSESKIYEYSGN